MANFSIGDKVRIKENNESGVGGSLAGEEGTVRSLNKDSTVSRISVDTDTYNNLLIRKEDLILLNSSGED